MSECWWVSADEWVLVKVKHAMIHNQKVKIFTLENNFKQTYFKLSNSQTTVDHWCETSLLPQAILKHVVSRDFIVKKFSWDQLCQSRVGHIWITLGASGSTGVTIDTPHAMEYLDVVWFTLYFNPVF